MGAACGLHPGYRLQRVFRTENHRALAGEYTTVAVIVAGRSRGPEREFGDATPEAIVRTAQSVFSEPKITVH